MKEVLKGEDIVEVWIIDIWGKDIGDFLIEYIILVLRFYEIFVVGIYVYKDIIFGFVYRVCWNGISDYLFDGEVLVLWIIGKGYGKRLIFYSYVVENDNFFWLDSNLDEGFVFLI